MKLLSCCKLWLYSAKIKTGNYLKIISLFKYCFYYKFNAILKSPRFPEIDCDFFSYRFLNKNSILIDGV